MTASELKNNPEAPPSPLKKTICIVQITRLGDLIQTAFVARALKKENENIELFLIARSTFANPLNFLLKDIFNKIFTIDMESIVDFKKSSFKKLYKKINKIY